MKFRIRIKTKNEQRFDFKKFSLSKKSSESNINNHLTIEDQKSKIKHRKLKIFIESLTAINQRLKT